MTPATNGWRIPKIALATLGTATLLATSLLIAPTAKAATAAVTIEASAATSTRSSKPTTSYATGTVIPVSKSSYTGYLQFDASGVDLSTLTRAELVLTPKSTPKHRKVLIRTVAVSAIQPITPKTAPRVGVIVGRSGTLHAKKKAVIRLTDLSAIKVVTALSLRLNSGGKATFYRTGSKAPVLRLTAAPAPASVPAPAPTPTPAVPAPTATATAPAPTVTVTTSAAPTTPAPTATATTLAPTATPSATATTPAPTATPSATATTPAPTATATPTPTATPSATATTPAPTATATATPTPTPTPSATVTASTATGSGVPAGTVLRKVSGDIVITTPGTVLENVDLDGYVTVKADNVTIRNSILRGGAAASSAKAIVMSWNGAKNLVVKDSTLIARNPNAWIDGVSGAELTVARLDISHVVDAVKIVGSNVTVKDSVFHDAYHQSSGVTYQSDGTTHNDGVQVEGGSNFVITGNTMSGFANSAIMVTQNIATINGLTINTNTLSGGACTINLAEKGKGPMSGVAITYNKFGAGDRAGFICPIILPLTTQAISTISNNTWLSDGTTATWRKGA